MKKLKAFDLIYFHGKSHFEDDGTQNWLAFQSIQKYFKTSISSYPTTKSCLFGIVKLTKHNNDVDQYKYSGHGIGFGRKGFFSIGNEI